MSILFYFIYLISFVNIVVPQGMGSGTNGNLRLCVVEGRGSYKRASRYCPILDEENSGVECVLGTDRLDCLRRMGKGTVDFGVFSPEDLIAAQWADLDVLVTNELRKRHRPFEQSIVAVVNRRILPENPSDLHAVLRGTTLCHPGVKANDLWPISDTLDEYIESLVTQKSCNTKLSLAENHVKSLADYFGKACKAGPWIPDKERDAELKRKYPSLCAACGSARCSSNDRYWGVSGALICLAERAGDFTWAKLDNIFNYFGLLPGTTQYGSPEQFAYLCRDGTWQPLTGNSDPCIWLSRPWPVIVAKRKASAAVSELTTSLTNSTVTVSKDWHGAMTALLETNEALPEPLHPQKTPLDYLGFARGFREAYSQSGCEPPRFVTLCTTSLLEKNKCEWLSEAGAVYGIGPPLQCVYRNNDTECMHAVRNGECDVAIGDSDWLVTGVRDSLVPLLHEITPIIEQMNTVVAYTRSNSSIKKMADLRGKRVAFPRFDGLAWHSVLRYIKNKEKVVCRDIIMDYFSEICAPGVENQNISPMFKQRLTKNCYKNGESILNGELYALRSLVEGRSEVAFISIKTFNTYTAKQIQETWAQITQEIVPVCPEENEKFCFISWSNIGHMFANKNLTEMRRHEIINLFSQLDQMFGKNDRFHNAMFSMYGPFNHQHDVLFHNNTRSLGMDSVLQMHPYDKIPLNFERGLKDTSDFCHTSEFARDFGFKTSPSILLFISTLVSYYLSSDI